MSNRPFEGMAETHKLDVIYELLTDDYKDLGERCEKTALAFGMMIGQTSELLNEIAGREMTQKEIYKSLSDIWKAAGLQIHGIYYKPHLKEFLETVLNQRGKPC